jgi:hypothetical protein
MNSNATAGFAIIFADIGTKFGKNQGLIGITLSVGPS